MKPRPSILPVYNVATWNLSRYADTCPEGTYTQLREMYWGGSIPDEESIDEQWMDLRDKRVKAVLERQLQSGMGILCLQESFPMRELAQGELRLRGILAIDALEYTVDEKGDAAVAWNSVKYEKVNEGAGDIKGCKIVVLKDRQTKKTVCVASVHLPGHDLFDPLKMREGVLETERGDKQLEATLKRMELFEASTYLLAGDFNTTQTSGAGRIPLALQHQFNLVNAAEEPTCFGKEGSKPKIDFIFAKSDVVMSRVETEFKLLDRSGTPNAKEDCLSDHAFVKASLALPDSPIRHRHSLGKF